MLRPHPALSKGEGSKEICFFKILSFGENLGEALYTGLLFHHSVFPQVFTIVAHQPNHHKIYNVHWDQ